MVIIINEWKLYKKKERDFTLLNYANCIRSTTWEAALFFTKEISYVIIIHFCFHWTKETERLFDDYVDDDDVDDLTLRNLKNLC